MAITKLWIAKVCTLALLLCSAALVQALPSDDATISIDRALNSPTLTIKYTATKVSLVELRVNGVSYGTRGANPSAKRGESNFTLDLTNLTDGDNEVEVRLYDKDGRLVGSQKSNISPDDGRKMPVYLISPKIGATIQGPVQITVGFGKQLHNTYVSFFVNNQFKAMSNTPPFTYIWDTTHETNGWHELEAWVVDDSSMTFKTKKVKVYVNNPGGNTTRKVFATEPTTKPIPPVATAVPPTPAITTPAVAIKAPPVTKATVKAQLPLTTSSNSVETGIAGASGLKASGLAAASAAERATAVVAPRVIASVPIKNEIRAETGSPAGVKGTTLPSVVSTGPQMMMPTHKRVAIPKVTAIAAAQISHPVVTKPIANTVSATTPPAKLSPGKLSPLPAVTAATTTVATAPPTPVVKTKTTVTVKAATQARPHLNNLASASLVRITHGQKLPNLGSFAITLDSKVVSFDRVTPRVQNGVPLTPFRYLFEQSGGTVDWKNFSKTVLANGHGREIYIKIGDKLAKVNSIPIELDLAPFLDRGRTIVPLSFIQDSLDVKIDFDPATGHVLITSNKKK